jgi:RNA polymerase sigma-70 factor (ECF subfamily)
MSAAHRADALDDFFEDGRAAWPGLSVDPDAFRAFVAEREDAQRSYAGDLYLAFACASGSAEALRALDPILREAAAGASVRIDASPQFADEVAQALRERLLVIPPPKIASYGGRASLRTWLGVSAARAAQNLRRGQAGRAKLHAAITSSTAASGQDIEREYVQGRYQERFKAALRRALAALPDRERTLLSLHLGERVSAGDLAARLGVGKSTITRWIRVARDRLIEETRERLCEELSITRSDYRSLAAVIRSEIDVSLVRLLGGG